MAIKVIRVTDPFNGRAFEIVPESLPSPYRNAPELLKALEGMMEWARRVKVRNPGMEVFNACVAIEKADGKP